MVPKQRRTFRRGTISGFRWGQAEMQMTFRTAWYNPHYVRPIYAHR